MGIDSATVAELDGLTIRFGGRTVVDGVSLTIRAGERWGLIGESGSGKSLTAAAVAGLAPRRAVLTGSVRLGGRELANAPERVLSRVRGREVSMMLQDSSVALNPLVRVGAQVARPLRTLHGYSRSAARTETLDWLAKVGLPDPEITAAAYPTLLSGGQRQRVCLAMALACRARLLIADEPTTALDPSVAQDILRLLDSSLSEAATGDGDRPGLLFISHDLAVVAQVCTQIAVMRRGRIIDRGPVAQIVSRPREEYTRVLVEAARLLAPATVAGAAR